MPLPLWVVVGGVKLAAIGLIALQRKRLTNASETPVHPVHRPHPEPQTSRPHKGPVIVEIDDAPPDQSSGQTTNRTRPL